MPPAELQHFFGLAAEYAGKQISLFSHRQEHETQPKPNYLDDAEEATCWDSMWLDMGGEG